MTHEEIAEIATPAQLRAWAAVEEHGSIGAAAESLGIDRRGVGRSYRALEAKLIAKGHDTPMKRIADSQRLKGVSTLFGADGEVKQTWVKTEKEDASVEVWRDVIDELTATIEPAPKIIPPNYGHEGLAGYPVGDLHLGMLAWGRETGGASWDLKIGEDVFRRSFGYLVDRSYPSGNCLLAFLGDFMHYDSTQAETPTAGNHLDSDGRYPKMVRASIRAMRFAIETAAKKHRNVRVIIEIGNHDLYSSVFLAEAMHALYEESEQVTIDTAPRHYHHFHYGDNLIATHHGHGAKPAQLPGLMATDWPQEWGATKHRVWWTGHVHNQRLFDFPGCSVESFRVLAPQDAWSAHKGYRSGRGMQAINFHPTLGETSRLTVNPEMFK
jgi:hypothetical protein